MDRPLRVLEFYAGIGGMHLSLREAKVDAEVVLALDVNDVTRAVYAHNFPGVRMCASLVESVSMQEYEALAADIYLMSPPCQPYTRTGRQLGSEDSRAKSFLRIIDMLGSMQHPPKYLLVENVKGFEVSETRSALVEQLERMGYAFREFLLTPLQFGVPNARLRYYLVAKRKPLKFLDDEQEACADAATSGCPPVQHTLPGTRAQTDSLLLSNLETQEARTLTDVREISEYLQLDDPQVESSYAIEQKTLDKHGWLFDIVKPTSRRSCCFTKGYGHHVRGTGSIVQLNADVDTAAAFEHFQGIEPRDASSQESEHPLAHLRLRYFTEREIARLMGFPETFGFPDTVTRRQRYRALGNSLSVTVVSALLRYLLTEPTA
ncbi:S-adenosyl-L-methionine-dependent methyltransferase [Thamnocephalis sphaerospora]|uniref:tRNA (cytosine(38)-C(5))-methyltransferase n=1 Tax=Thamnocephalis sphaerospora TaxID=78915 RepID=A0A4P9XME6_9FUNG|nr:S-adenosyl-L-methionine-dependent methyltransferase [Thamnocephalis sphaerospora]|eukprot:RKP06541.1 S-adenosyl-L-methionine-dependent methyltransferase [Thamnocephalis sphaerospora]